MATHSNMESRINSRKASENKPLPGERQGTSGASAGRDSLQAASGVLLNRRAHTGSPEATTADERSTQIQSAAPANSVSWTSLGTTQAGLPRRRLHWTTDMNENIVRIFQRTTRCETVYLGYRQELYKRFMELYPHLTQITEQNVADRRALIYKSEKYVSRIRREEIKAEVQTEMRRNEGREETIEPIVELMPQISEPDVIIQQVDACPNEHQHSEDSIEIPLLEQLRQQYQTTKAEYWGFAYQTRPRIPRQHSSKKLAQLIKLANENILPTEMERVKNITHDQIDSTIYCMAMAIVKANGGKIIESREQAHRQQHEPPWKIRLERRIKRLRSDIAVLEAYLRGNKGKKMKRKASKIMKMHRKHAAYNPENEYILEYIDTLKQKLSLYSQRLRRYNKSLKRKNDNQTFNRNQKVFYRRLNGEIQSIELPGKSAVEEFWGRIWSTEGHFQDNTSWMSDVTNPTATIRHMETNEISMDILQATIRKLANWKCPGPDGLHNIWFKRFTCLHEKILTLVNHYLKNPEETPDILSEGVTYLKPKTNDTTHPGNYRPITCLNALYKIMTGCLHTIIEQHCTQNNIISKTQKGSCKGSLGSREQLIIDSVIMSQACGRKRNLYTCFIDYKKAFDMVPHDWLIHVLRMYGINPMIVEFLKFVMNHWCTRIHMHSGNKRVVSKILKIKRGIFQGDSLSPFWFCLAINPLSFLLDNTKLGFELKGQEKCVITHLAYMDDIKLYSGSLQGLKKLIYITERFSSDIGMQFGIEKCKIQSIQRGKFTDSTEHETASREIITALGMNEFYKYLGIQQNKMIIHSQIKEKLKTEFTNRLNTILKTSLNSRNLTTAINTYAIPVITYSLGIIKWTRTDLDSLERIIRVQMTRFKYHHPKSSIQRITLPRKLGGRGILNIGNLHAKLITDMREYFNEKALSSQLYRVIQQVDENYTPLNLKQQNVLHEQPTQAELLEQWKQKALHGRYPTEIAKSNVDACLSYKWLKIGYLYPETEGFLIAIQDQVIATRNYLKHIIKDPEVPSDICRACGVGQETIQHITTGCSMLAPTDYKQRHDMVARIIHAKLARKCGTASEFDTPYYKYHPQNVIENNIYKLLWDRSVLTDRTVRHNRPDVILWDKSKRKVWLIDIAVVDTSNLDTTHKKKIQKYRELAEVIKEQWHVLEVEIVPIVLSATGVIPTVLKHSLKKLGIETNIIINLQKAVILSTCSLVRRFMGS